MSQLSTDSDAVCVVGLGKIGLPLAVQFASSGRRVVGADIDSAVVERVNSGLEPHPGEAELEQRLRHVHETGSLTATIDTVDAVRSASVVVVVVPLVVGADREPDYTAIDAATADVAAGLQPGTLVVYETTLPTGTTRGRFTPALERSGLTAGNDFFVAFSPERVYAGRVFHDLRSYPKLVGGIDAASTERACEFYRSVLEFDQRDDLGRANGVWPMRSAEAAELTKLAETTYRDINIAFANELATHAEQIDLDVIDVIDAANSQPFCHLHRPGIAVGGHCIPVYPHLLLASAPSLALPATARAINREMPRRTVDRLVDAIGPIDDLTVGVLGVAYRGGVKETAFSGAFDVVGALRDRRARPVVHDPLYTPEEISELGLTPYQLGDRCDVAIIQADHDEYRTLEPHSLPGVRALYDGRGITDPAVWASAGVTHLRVGEGRSHAGNRTGDLPEPSTDGDGSR